MDIHNFFLETDKPQEEEGLSFLKCLCMSLSDEEGQTLIKRHTVLMNHYLDRRRNGIKSVDLPYLVSILEFFSENSADEENYFTLLMHCLKLLMKPLLLHKSSDACFAVEHFKIFYSALGNCLHVVADTIIESTILDVILFLLTYKEKSSQEVTLEIRLEAAESSCLPEILVAIMFFITDELYHPLIEIMYQLSLQPSIATLFQSLGCVDYWIKKVAIKNTISTREAFIKETTGNLLWSLLRYPGTDDDLNMNSESLSILRGWLRREVLYGQKYERNNIAALLLEAFVKIPNLEISRSGILDDVGLLAFATEFGTDNTWASKVKFKATRDDLDFKKIMITILLIKNEDLITKIVLSKNRSINALAYILDWQNCNHALKWNNFHQIELLNCILYALPIFSKHFKQEYTYSGATMRILKLIEYFTFERRNLRLVKNCCLCLHLLVSNEISQRHFRELNVPKALIRLIVYFLEKLKLDLVVQTIITYCFCTITNLVRDDKKSKGSLQQDLEYLFSITFTRLQKPQDDDSKISTSLLISVYDFAWQCIFLNENSKKFFYETLGVYSLFNVMEGAPFAAQIIFLSMLSDICIDPRSLPQIATWRGKDKDNSFFKMLCDLWRKQEQMKGVQRDEHGCIEDIEYSLMGEKQEIELKSENVDISTSPALVDMIGCMRPKIAVAVDLITRRHFERIKLGCSIYCVPFLSSISHEDQITLQIIQCYEELKLGEVLLEIQKAVDKVDVKLLPLDVEVLHQLIMRLIGLASKVQRSQRSILKTMRKMEHDEEHKIYKKIEENKIAKSIKEIVERDFDMTVSNQIYRKWKHQTYEEFLKKIEELYAHKKEENFHLTFYHPRNFIVVKTGRDAHIISIKRKEEPFIMSYHHEDVLGESISDDQIITRD